MLNTVEEFIDKGVSLKRSGKFKEAMDCYIKALDIDPQNMKTYISLGKTAHLLNNQDLAIKCYLAATHILLSPIDEEIQQNKLPLYLEVQYNAFPKDILASLPKKSAFAIFIDSNTPRHTAHSIVDLDASFIKQNPGLVPYSDIYRSHILGDGNYDEVLSKYGLTTTNQMNYDEEFYIPIGRSFNIDHIKWDKLSQLNVVDLYF